MSQRQVHHSLYLLAQLREAEGIVAGEEKTER